MVTRASPEGVMAIPEGAMIDVVSQEHMDYAHRVLSILDTYGKAEDLINIGAYVSGSNPKIDYAINMIDKVNQFLQQPIAEKVSFEESVQVVKKLFH